MQVNEGLLTDRTVVTDALDVKETSIGCKADLFQIFEVLQSASYTEVIGVVDHRFGPQGTALLEVLFDARSLVVHMQRRRDAVGDDAGAVP